MEKPTCWDATTTTRLSLLQQLKRFVNKISAEATEFMQPSIAPSLNQHLELEQSRRHLDGIDLQRLKEMAKILAELAARAR